MMRISFLNIQIDNLTMQEALDEIRSIIESGSPGYVVTPNVDHIIKIENDNDFRQVYQNADLVLTDGKPLIWISRLMGTPIKEKISGSDLFPELCQMAAQKGYKIFLLGAADGIAVKAAENMKTLYQGIQIAGTYSPPFGFEQNIEEINKVIKKVQDTKPDILVVGLGAPKQEKFIYNYLEQLNVPVSLGLGASIDFMAGNIRRAPKWMSELGLEWFYRFLKEPRRLFKRYFIDDFKIFILVWKYRKST